MKIIKYEDKYRDDMIFMILEAKNALGRVPGLNEDLLDIKRNYLDAGAMPLAEIMTQHKYLGLPSFESVSRTRRKLQARYPELVGSRHVQKMRATGEKAYRRYAKE